MAGLNSSTSMDMNSKALKTSIAPITSRQIDDLEKAMGSYGGTHATAKGGDKGKGRARDEDDFDKAHPKKSRTEHTLALKTLQDRLQGKPRVARILTPYLQLILATRHFTDNILPSLIIRADAEQDMDLREEIDFLLDKNSIATASFATHFATNDADNFTVPLAVAERFLNAGLGDFSEGTLKSLGVTPDQMKVVDAVLKENKEAKKVKKKDSDNNLFCQKCGRTGHEAATCFAKTLAPGFSPSNGPAATRRDRDRGNSPGLRRQRSRSPRFFSRDRHFSPRR